MAVSNLTSSNYQDYYTYNITIYLVSSRIHFKSPNPLFFGCPKKIRYFNVLRQRGWVEQLPDPNLFYCRLAYYGAGLPADRGEAEGQAPYQRDQTSCVTLNRYSSGPVGIGPATGDREKDTVGYVHLASETLCPISW